MPMPKTRTTTTTEPPARELPPDAIPPDRPASPEAIRVARVVFNSPVNIGGKSQAQQSVRECMAGDGTTPGRQTYAIWFLPWLQAFQIVALEEPANAMTRVVRVERNKVSSWVEWRPGLKY